MPTNDTPIHLGKASQEIPVTLFQDHLDGLCTLIHFCNGLAAAGKGEVPGSFELVMHYQELKSRVNASKK